MTGMMENMFLHSKGLNDDDIALLNKEIPDIDNLVAVVQSHIAQMNRVLTLLPLVRKILAAEREGG